MNEISHRQPGELVPSTQLTQELDSQYYVEPQHAGFNARDILNVLRRQLWIIVLAVTVAVGVAAYLVSREVPVYTSTGIVRVFSRSEVVNGTVVSATPVGKNNNPLLSEVMIVTGRTVLERVVEKEGFRLFTEEPYSPSTIADSVVVTLPPDERGFVHLTFEDDVVEYGPEEDRRRAPYGAPIELDGVRFVIPERPDRARATLHVVPEYEAVDFLSASLQANPLLATGGIEVTFTSLNPDIGPPVINSIIREYQRIEAESARENVRLRREFLEEQIKTTDSLMVAAQSSLSGLRSRERSYSAQGKFSSAQGQLMSVEVREAELRAELQMQEELLQSLGQGGPGSADLDAILSVPGIRSAPIVSQLYGQLVSYRNQREEMLAGPWARAPSHPDVQRLNTLIASTESKLVAAIRDNVSALRAQIESLGGLKGRALAQMGSLPYAEVQEVYLTQNLAALQQMGNQLRGQYQSVRLEEAGMTGHVEIVQRASAAYAVGSKPAMKLLLGLLTGLMIGIGLAFIREKLDPSIHRPEDIEELLLVPNLGIIPQASPYLLQGSGNNGGSQERQEIEPAGAEAYRVLRTNLLFSQGGLKTLVVTSAAPGEGKTMTALNLAASCARQGLRTLLMECDLRRPSLKQYFETDEGKDLSNVLLENQPWEAAIQRTRMPLLDVLLAGSYFPRASEFLAGSEMKALIRELSARYDMVILDTSPLLVAADATVLGAIVDGVLLVVRATATERGAVQQAVHQLTLVGAHIVGTVLNDPEGSIASYGDYYDYSAEYETR